MEISVSLPEPGSVRLSIFDVQGRLLARPVDEIRPAGLNQFLWDSREGHDPLASGLYFVRLEASGRSASGRFVLLH